MIPILSVFFLLFSSIESYPNPTPTNGTCAYDGLTMADPYDLTAYYQCCKNQWFLKYCLEREIFDKYKLTCILSDSPVPTPTRNHHHFRPTTLVCTPGDRRQNPFDNSKFDECVDGIHWVTESCQFGFKFNSNTKQCQYLPTTTDCSVGDTRPISNGDPSKYLLCDGNEWEIRDCSSGFIYDQNLKKCIQKYTTPGVPTQAPNGFCQESMSQEGYKPNPQNCQTYFQCVHGEWQLRNCGTGTKWMQSIIACDYYNGVC